MQAQFILRFSTFLFLVFSLKAQLIAGDTLYHEDFAGQLPTGWTSQSQSSTSHLWIWSNTAPGGQYSAQALALNSPSSANGYLLLPSDLYNTPSPTGGFVNVNASITSSAISIIPKPSVHLSFYQSQRFYGNNTNSLYVEVSADSVNWTVFSTINNRTAEASSENGEYMRINVSSVLANQSTAYLRFVQSGASHYYWMIDDVMLLEGPSRQLKLSKIRMSSSDTFRINPISYVRPAYNACPRFFEFDVENIGANTLNNAFCVSKLFQDSSAQLIPAAGLLSVDTLFLQNQFNPGDQQTVNHNCTGYIRNEGAYTYSLECMADSTFDSPAVDSVRYYNTNSRLAKTEQDTFIASIGTHQFIGGGNFRDFIGNLFTVAQGDTVLSLSFFIPDEPSIIGAQILPRVYLYEEDSSSLSGALSVVIAESLVPTTVSASMLGRWIDFDFNAGTGPQWLQAGQYVGGVSLVDLSSNPTPFLIGRDLEAERSQVEPQSLVLINDSLHGWKWISQVPAVRLNFATQTLPPFSNILCSNSSVSIKDNEKKTTHFSLFPNPSRGKITLKSSKFINEQITLSVIDLQARVVFRKVNFEQNSKEFNLNLDFLKSGIYFIQLRTDSYTSTKRIVIQGE